MPYIDQALRERFEALGHHPNVMGATANTEGELNYLITCAVHGYLGVHGTNYKNLNAVIGVLECAKLEVYRRKAAPYEDKKIATNGDVP